MRRLGLLMVLVTACGGGGECDLSPVFEVGTDGSVDPLGAMAGEARAGRVTAADLPADPSGLAMWRENDFVVANSKVAMVIEDAGPSDHYDPWGGRPVGIARVVGGNLIEPASMSELFVLTGRESVVTNSVSVIADGSDGGPAIVRASGLLAPTPAFESIASLIYSNEHEDIPTAIEYVLEPDAEHVDIYTVYKCLRDEPATLLSQINTFMYLYRSQQYAPNDGFDIGGGFLDFVGYVSDDATSFAYSAPNDEPLETGLTVAGFSANFSSGYTIEACAETRRHFARIDIGGPGLDGLLLARARRTQSQLRAISGTVRDSQGAPAQGVRIHATDTTDNYITRTQTDSSGNYQLHVPEATADVILYAYRPGDNIKTTQITASDNTADFNLDPTGTISVTVSDGIGPIPAKVQLLPDGASVVVPALAWGEKPLHGGRQEVVYAHDGTATITAPAGNWQLVVSRGFEYELYDQAVTVTGNMTTSVNVVINRVVDTTGALCGDFHIHTHRSPDAPDDSLLKVRSIAAEGVEIAVRSEHEWVDNFDQEIATLGLGNWISSVGSLELTTFQQYGHFGVLPLEPDASARNQGAIEWMKFPTTTTPLQAVELVRPLELFDRVRSRPESPTMIINHPYDGSDYFAYAGYDWETGQVDLPDDWDTAFTAVEVFNESGWVKNRFEIVRDWLSMLKFGRRVFAVGSSDSHRVHSTPTGYPRTCMYLGTDAPEATTPNQVRDAVAQGHSTIFGGIYVTAAVDGKGPGEDALGVGASATLSIQLQAAEWVNVDTIEIVVDGETFETVPVTPGDAVNNIIRYDATHIIPVAASGSSVVVAAYAAGDLSPVYPGREPFGASNPIFLSQ